MAAAPPDPQLERGAHLLRRRTEVEHLAAELDAVAGALVDGEVRADCVRVLLDEPLQAEAVADLLVGGGDEDQVARAAPPCAGERRERDRGRGDLALHVERPTPPDLVADQLATERVTLPLARIRQHDVGVREQGKRRAVAAPGDARDEVRPLRHARVQPAFDARSLEVVAQHLGCERLVAGRVRRVEADQLLQEREDVVQRRTPVTSRYGLRCATGPAPKKSTHAWCMSAPRSASPS